MYRRGHLWRPPRPIQLRPGRVQRQRRGPGQGRQSRCTRPFRTPAILQGADLANAFMGGRADFPQRHPGGQESRAPANIADGREASTASTPPSPWRSTWTTARTIDACVKAAIAGGYTSVMIDGCTLSPGAERRADPGSGEVRPCRGASSVEGELGVLAGHGGPRVQPPPPPTPTRLDAVEFIQQTGVRRPGHHLRHPCTGPTRARTPSSAGRSPSPPRSACGRQGISCASSSATAPPPSPSISSRRSTTLGGDIQQRLRHRRWTSSSPPAPAASARSTWTPTSAWPSPAT